ncbi:MAG: hypothetical protein ABI870_10235 [Rhodanobacter sp.]
MRYRFCASVSMLLFASVVMAQVAAPASTPASDSWASHPATSSSSYAAHSPREVPRSADHFKFKSPSDHGPMSQPPPSANDKAAVMGTDRAWQDGRPPVDCAQTPQDPKCH